MTVISMPEAAEPTQPVEFPAEEVILGVDTHKDVHVAVVLTVLGALLSHREFPATAAGYRQLLAWARSFGVLRRAGVECTGSYGATLARVLRHEGVQVIEVNQPDRPAAASTARPTRSTPTPQHARCCRDEPRPRRRPAKGRWRTCACYVWPKSPRRPVLWPEAASDGGGPYRPSRRRRLHLLPAVPRDCDAAVCVGANRAAGPGDAAGRPRPARGA